MYVTSIPKVRQVYHFQLIDQLAENDKQFFEIVGSNREI